MNSYFKDQEQYEILQNKLQQLKKAHIFETDIPNKLRLEQQIEDVEQELLEFENKLTFLGINRIILNLNGSNYQVYCIFSDKASIGRASTSDFIINDSFDKISNFHAGILYNLEKNEYWIEDLNSTNGTYIDEVKIEKPTRLVGNTKVRLGSSLSFLFQNSKDDVLSPAVLIQYDANDEETARYIIIPKGKVLVGTNPNEVVRFPKLRDEYSLGSIERKTDGFYFISVANEETLLKHNMELSLDFFKVRIIILSVVRKEDIDDPTKKDDNPGNKIKREIVKPTGYEIPPNLQKINIFLGLFVLLIGVVFNWILFKPDTARIGSQWINECVESLNRKENRSWWDKWLGVRESNWHIEPSIWPPNERVIYIVSRSSTLDNFDVKTEFIKKSGLDVNKINYKYDRYSDLVNDSFEKFSISKNEKTSNAPWIRIKILEELGFLSLNIDYWSDDDLLSKSNSPTFEFKKKEFLYWHIILLFLFTIYLSYFIHDWKIKDYRDKLQKEYDNFQTERTKKIFEAQSRLEAQKACSIR